MFQYYPKQMILDTLWFKRMPDFVEILGFYSFALMWLPFFLDNPREEPSIATRRNLESCPQRQPALSEVVDAESFVLACIAKH